MMECLLVTATIFKSLTQGEINLNLIQCLNLGAGFRGLHSTNLLIIKLIGFSIRQTPVGVTKVRIDTVGLFESLCSKISVTLGIVNMTQRDK